MKPTTRSRIALVSIATAASIGGCMLFPSVPVEDASHASFVRQAVPILHGRKIRGYDETKLLSDLVTLTDKETVLRALMAQPEFIDHWSEVLVDDLHVQREGQQARPSCYADAMRATVDPGIAQTATTQPPATAAAGGAYNMSDMVRSALAMDNLYPLYRAHLYAHAGTGPITFDELQDRDILGAQFGEMYLNRQVGCLICHNSEFSMSGQSSGWNRTYPILGLFEKALFGASTGEPTRNAYAMFRGDNVSGPLQPWGVQSCGSFKTTLATDGQGVTEYFVQSQGQQFGVHKLQGLFNNGYQSLKANGLQRHLPASVQATCTFCQANCQGNTVSPEQAANNAPNASSVKSLLVGTCMGCHGGASNLYFTNGNDWANDLIGVASAQKPGETLVIPGDADNSYLIKKLNGAAGIAGSRMPLGQAPFTAAQINMIRAWINGMPTQGACQQCTTVDCGQVPQDVDGEPGFAYLVAARIVNNVWEEVFGSKVTIANYFPRNFEQRQVLWNLTEYNFLPHDWSLRSLLVRMMTSDMFNRVPPRTTAHANAYELPPVFDPWIVLDPRIPPVSDPGYDPAAHPADNKNAMSEESYRYSARSLTNSVAAALDWPKPRRFPGGTYPDANLMRSIGMYFSDSQPGFQTPDFAGLLAWETVHGQCVNPNPANPDWVSRVMVAINGWDAAANGGPLTVEDVSITMRDWLLGYGGLGSTPPQGLAQSERDALQAHFGVAALSAQVSTVTGLEAKLRALCGKHLESPQFQLAGIVEAGLGPKPRLRVCNTATCTYQQMCLAIKPAIDSQISNGTLLCGTDTVDILHRIRPPRPWEELLCPPGLCGVIGHLINEGCPILDVGVKQTGSFVERLANGNLGGRCTPQAPACDPRCSRIDCCGGPLPNDLRAGDVMVAWAEGGIVESADKAGIQRKGASGIDVLQSGMRVAAGDLIALPAGSRMALRTPEGKVLRTPDEGMPAREDKRPVVMLVSGESALRTRQPNVPPPANLVPRERILRIMSSPVHARGEGGMLLTPERLQAYRYPDAELKAAEQRRLEITQAQPKR